MSERTSNTRYNLRCTVHARARSAPPSPEAVAEGKDTLADTSRLYSDVVKANDLAPGRVSDVSPDLRNISSEYPDGQRSSEAIIAGELTAICTSDTLTVKGLPGTPGSNLTSVYSTPALKGSETDGDDREEWTTVTRKSRPGSPARKSRCESPAREHLNKSRLGPKQEQTVQEAIRQLTDGQRQKITDRQCVISITGTKRPGTKSTSSRGEGPSNLKGKGLDPRNWGALSGYENELDLEAQREALASWKTVQELARSEQENKPDLSAKGTESDVEAQRDAIASWNKAHELAREEPTSANVSVRASSPEGHVKVISPKGERTAEKRMHKPQKADKERKKPTRKPEKAGREKERHARETPDPVHVMVDKTIAQDKSRHERRKTPRAMEPVEQINPKSYIGLAFKRLGGKDKPAHKSSSEDGSLSDESSSASKRKQSKGKKRRQSSSSEPPSTSESSGSSTDTDDRSSDSGSSLSSSNSRPSRRHKRRSKHS